MKKDQWRSFKKNDTNYYRVDVLNSSLIEFKSSQECIGRRVYIIEATKDVSEKELEKIFRRIKVDFNDYVSDTNVSGIEFGKKYRFRFGDPREVVGVAERLVFINQDQYLKIKVSDKIYFYIYAVGDKLFHADFKEVK